VVPIISISAFYFTQPKFHNIKLQKHILILIKTVERDGSQHRSGHILKNGAKGLLLADANVTT